jgi:hypothetical protein
MLIAGFRDSLYYGQKVGLGIGAGTQDFQFAADFPDFGLHAYPARSIDDTCEGGSLIIMITDLPPQTLVCARLAGAELLWSAFFHRLVNLARRLKV